jgi:hypothetical protein
MRGDARSRRLVVVPDALLNPPPGSPDHVTALGADGWGVVVLPPPGLAPAARATWLEAVVEEVVTFLDDGYEVALARVEDEALTELRRALGAAGYEVTRELELAR